MELDEFSALGMGCKHRKELYQEFGFLARAMDQIGCADNPDRLGLQSWSYRLGMIEWLCSLCR